MSHLNQRVAVCRYWINPVSWILYGFVASQLGQVESDFTQVCSRLCHSQGAPCFVKSAIGPLPAAYNGINHLAELRMTSAKRWSAMACRPGGMQSTRQVSVLTLVLPFLQNDGSVITVRAYLRQHFNFRYDMLGVAVAVLCAYIALYG